MAAVRARAPVEHAGRLLSTERRAEEHAASAARLRAELLRWKRQCAAVAPGSVAAGAAAAAAAMDDGDDDGDGGAEDEDDDMGVEDAGGRRMAALEAQAAAAVGQLHASGDVRAIRTLRRLLCSRDPPIDAILRGRPVGVLALVLQTGSVEHRLEAAWCLTNLSMGTQAQAVQVVEAAPALIALLSSQIPDLQEQAAWALANLAADCRDTVRANGAVRPLIALLRSDSAPLVATAAFALKNLLRGPDRAVHEFVDADVVAACTDALTAFAGVAHVVEELLGFVVFLLASGRETTQLLIERGFVDLVAPFWAAAPAAEHKPGLRHMVVRFLGFLVQALDAEAIQALVQRYPQLVAYVLGCARMTHQRELAREGTWVVALLLGSTAPLPHQMLLAQGCIDHIAHFLAKPVGYPTDAETQIEAFFAACSLCASEAPLVAQAGLAEPLARILDAYGQDPEVAAAGRSALDLLRGGGS